MKKEIRNWRNWVLMSLMLLGLFCIVYATGEASQEIGVIRQTVHIFFFMFCALCFFAVTIVLLCYWKDEGEIPFIAKLMEDE